MSCRFVAATTMMLWDWVKPFQLDEQLVQRLFKQRAATRPASSSSTSSIAVAAIAAATREATRSASRREQLSSSWTAHPVQSIIVVAATNRQDILDPALLRPDASIAR